MEDRKSPFRLNHPDLEALNRGLDRRNFLQKTAMGFGATIVSTHAHSRLT